MKAEAQASDSARKARKAAIAAEASYGAAQGYAASAFKAAEQARQSALNAHQSATEAYGKYRNTVARYKAERYTAEQQGLLEQKMADFEDEMQQVPEVGGTSEIQNLIQTILGNDPPPGMSLKDFIQLKLDIAGLMPVVGEPADLVNCIAYGFESGVTQSFKYGTDVWKDALLSCASMVPIAGWAVAPSKAARWAEKFGGKFDETFEAIGNLFKRNPCNSFPAGTLVLMGDGSKRPIERIAVNDLVQAADPVSGRSGPRMVQATIFTPDDRDFTAITLDEATGGGSVTATDEHPFWSVGPKQWKHAADLSAGDRLLTPGGESARIDQVRHWKERQSAYNLTIDDLNTYYVLAGDTPVLVHNSRCLTGSIVGPQGETLWLPKGRKAVAQADSGKGWFYSIKPSEAKDNGLHRSVRFVRVMDPVTTGPYQYPKGYITYANEAGQFVDPVTGKTLSKRDRYWHIPIP